MKPQTIDAYHEAQLPDDRAICVALAAQINTALPHAERKVWHGAPVWFLDGNPIVGYWVRKRGVQLLFWSGQSFQTPGLTPEGKFKAAELRVMQLDQLGAAPVAAWLQEAAVKQWDYRNLIKRRGVLERLGNWE